MGIADAETWKLIFQGVGTLCTVAALILAVRAIFGPKLRLSLHDPSGELTPYGNSPNAPLAYFYHLRVRNKRKRIANNVSLKLIKISKSRPDGTFPDGELPSHLKLR